MKALDTFLKNIDVNRLKAAFFMLLGIIVVGGFALFLNTYLYKSRASEDKVNIVIDPLAATWAPNTDYNVMARLDPDSVGKRISGFDLTYYASDPVQVVGVGLPVAVGDDSVVFTKVIQTANRVSYVIQGEPLAISVSIPFTVRGVSEGTGMFSFDREKSRIIGDIPSYAYTINGIGQAAYTFANTVPSPTVNPNVTTIPTNVPITGDPGPSIRPTDPPGNTTSAPVGPKVVETMLLKFQGITAEVSQKMKVKLTAVSLTGVKSEVTAEFTSGAGGVWSAHDVVFENIDPNERYYILVKGEKSIQKKVCVARPTETAVGSYSCSNGEINLANESLLDFSGIRIMAGDLSPQDGQVDSYDLSFILNNLGSTDANVNNVGDVNLNGRVDTQDYSLLIQSLTIKSDEN